jgi:sigma-B regulation protein RsbU (phosphoserine phosphatase)
MRILVIDDAPVAASRLASRLESWGHEVHLELTAESALPQVAKRGPEVVVYRWRSGTADDLDLIRRVRAEIPGQYVYTLVLSSKRKASAVVAALDAGADEVLTKPFRSRELRARLQSAERVAHLGKALADSNRQMRADLDAGARFARSLLPKPLTSPWAVDFRNIPATAVSGDAFGYHWMDSDLFALYLLDASGHGLDAALLAVSVMNVLRSAMLPDTNFRKPNEVLRALNRAFPMEDYGDKCFSIWYGVASRKTRRLIWASGGHPPPVLLGPKGDVQLLKATGPVMGAAEVAHAVQTVAVPEGSRLYLYSDGVSEIRTGPDERRSNEEFVALLRDLPAQGTLDAIINNHHTLRHGLPPDDDLSLVEVRF